jgi:hypothetical protein
MMGTRFGQIGGQGERMPGVRKLPTGEALVRHAADGMTNKEIGELYGVTGEAVRQALEKAGFTRDNPRPSHAYYIPWKVRADHVGDVLARRLRAYSKRQQGKQLTETESRLLDEWLKFMDGGNSQGVPLSVHYDRTDDEGFWLEPRQYGDRDYISPPMSD